MGLITRCFARPACTFLIRCAMRPPGTAAAGAIAAHASRLAWLVGRVAASANTPISSRPREHPPVHLSHDVGEIGVVGSARAVKDDPSLGVAREDAVTEDDFPVVCSPASAPRTVEQDGRERPNVPERVRPSARHWQQGIAKLRRRGEQRIHRGTIACAASLGTDARAGGPVLGRCSLHFIDRRTHEPASSAPIGAELRARSPLE